MVSDCQTGRSFTRDEGTESCSFSKMHERERRNSIFESFTKECESVQTKRKCYDYPHSGPSAYQANTREQARQQMCGCGCLEGQTARPAPFMPFQPMFQPHFGYMPMGPSHMQPYMCMPPYSGPVYINHHYAPHQFSAQFPQPPAESKAYRKAYEKQMVKAKIQISESRKQRSACHPRENEESLAEAFRTTEARLIKP